MEWQRATIRAVPIRFICTASCKASSKRTVAAQWNTTWTWNSQIWIYIYFFNVLHYHKSLDDHVGWDQVHPRWDLQPLHEFSTGDLDSLSEFDWIGYSKIFVSRDLQSRIRPRESFEDDHWEIGLFAVELGSKSFWLWVLSRWVSRQGPGRSNG